MREAFGKNRSDRMAERLPRQGAPGIDRANTLRAWTIARADDHICAVDMRDIVEADELRGWVGEGWATMLV